MTASLLQDYAGAYSDMYKDAHGFRPRHDVSDWTEQDFHQEFDRLSAIINEQIKWEKEAQAVAVVEFEATIVRLINIGAKDRAAAIAWLHGAELTNGNTNFLEFCMGLPYGYLTE